MKFPWIGVFMGHVVTCVPCVSGVAKETDGTRRLICALQASHVYETAIKNQNGPSAQAHDPGDVPHRDDVTCVLGGGQATILEEREVITLRSTEVRGKSMGATDDCCVGRYSGGEVDKRTSQVDVRMRLSIDIVVCPYLRMFMEGLPYHM